MLKKLSLVLFALTFLLFVSAATAVAADESPAAPSEYVESISSPTAYGQGVIGESDALSAEADSIAASDVPSSVSAARQYRVEEIVVSARKRSELLEDTPVSVTALSAERLREAGVNRIDDIQELVPNLTFQTSSTGTEALVYIRGVGLPRALTSFDPGVGIYIDGIYLPRAQGSLLDVVDIAQIEVLRGPQGTLFGKNTVGGAVNFTTQKPTDQFEAEVFVRTGNVDAPKTSFLNLVDTRAMLNIPINFGPLEDKVFTRLAFGSQNRAGYMYNTLLEQGWNDRNSVAFLGSVRILPHEDVTIDISGNWDRSHSRGQGAECVFVQPTGLQALQPGLVEYCQSEREDYHFAADWPQFFDITSMGSWGVLNWDVGELPGLDEFSVKLLGSWRQQRIRGFGDVDLTPTPAVNNAGLGDTQPFGDVDDPNDALRGLPTRAQQFQGELQVNGAALDGRLNFVSGYFVFWENSHVQQGSQALTDTLNQRTVRPQFTDNWSWAIYSQTSYDVLDWLQLTGGLRYTEDKKGVTSENFACVSEPGGTCVDWLQDFNESNSAIFTAWSPMGSIAATVPGDLLDGTPVDHFMTYFTYSQGFRGGGFNVIPQPNEDTGVLQLQSFGPETLGSFEMGFKMLAFDRRLSTNLSVFLAKYDNIQVTSVRDLGDPDGDGVPNIAQETLNAASATTKGIELETLLNLGEGWRLEGSVGLFEGVYGEFLEAVSDMTGETIDRSGETFNRVPEMQVHMAVQHAWPIEMPGPEWISGYLTPRLDWYYQSKVHFFGPEFWPGRQSGYNLIHSRLAYSFNDDLTQIALWGQNLTNQRYLTNSLPLATSFGIALDLYGMPRSYGVEIKHVF